MARHIRITGGVLNVRLHPHPDGIYGEFIEALYALRRSVKIRGERYAMISLLNRGEGGEGIYRGLITTFTKIDTEEPWFNAGNMREADDSEVSQIVIPDNLYPNAAAFNFLFDTNNHKIYIQTYSKGKLLSIKLADKPFSELSTDLSITRQFNRASITISQSKAGLARVFDLPVIKRVTITLLKPNADVFEDDFDEKIEGFLQEIHSRKMTVTVEAEPGRSVVPNAGLRRVSESALEHGAVTVDGRDADGTTRRSTEDFPRIIHSRYDPDVTSEDNAFRQMTGR